MDPNPTATQADAAWHEQYLARQCKPHGIVDCAVCSAPAAAATITSGMAIAAARALHRSDLPPAQRAGADIEWDAFTDPERSRYVIAAVDVLRAGLTVATPLARQQQLHHHEQWQLQESARGGLYCAACGASVGC